MDRDVWSIDEAKLGSMVHTSRSISNLFLEYSAIIVFDYLIIARNCLPKKTCEFVGLVELFFVKSF